MKDFKRQLIVILIPSMLFAATPAGFAFAENADTAPPVAEKSQPAVVEDAPIATETPPESAVIVTGNAVADSTIQNIANTTTLETSNQASTTESVSSSQGDSSEAASTPQVIEFTTENNSQAQNDSTTAADTGSNATNNNGGNASIETGNAYAQANVLNVLNTNIFNSNGFFFLLNSFFGNIGNIDVRGMSAANDSLLSCGTFCNGTSTPLRTVVSSDNTASIENDVIVRGATGGNGASDNGGDATIGTGDAFAAANLVNVANTNIVDSNYMLLVFNNFGDWNGDLIFPNADFFASRFFGNPSIVMPTSSVSPDSEATRSVSISNTNEALVENSATTTADTGDNEASGNGNGIIQSGDAISQTTVHNTVNSNFFNNDSFVVLFKVYGSWSGNVFNAPKNISWRETPQGVSLFSNDEGENEQASTTVPLSGETATSIGGGSSSFSASSTNRAAIRNHVQVYALTGGNRANRNNNASIQSGNAYASTNIVNIANTNIVGRNWVLAIVNIFGDWSGSVSFGQPDLWVGSSVDVGSGAVPRSRPVYHFTIANRGDADANHVKLKVRADKPLLFFNQSDRSDAEWDIGTIPAGASVEATYTADVSSTVPYGEHQVTTAVSVSSLENDSNASDNNDIIAIAVKNLPSHNRRAALNYTSDPVLTISKTVIGSTSLYQRETASYKIVIDNRGGEAYHSVLVDMLKNEAGEVVNEQKWELDTILPNEQITVTYQTVFSASTTAGIYTNYARLETIGRHPSLEPFLGDYVNSNEASTSVLILALPEKNVDGIGGDMDIATTIESTIATSTLSESVASATSTFLGTLERGVKRIFGSHFPSLEGAAFSADTLKPPLPPFSWPNELAAVAFGTHPMARDFRLYLLLILAAFQINYLYRKRPSWPQGRFTDFL